MFGHVMIGANDISASKKFYDAVMGALGVSPGKIRIMGSRLDYFPPKIIEPGPFNCSVKVHPE